MASHLAPNTYSPKMPSDCVPSLLHYLPWLPSTLPFHPVVSTVLASCSIPHSKDFLYNSPPSVPLSLPCLLFLASL